MPTKRVRRLRRRRDHDVPRWARRLLETGQRPERESEDFDAFVGWLYFHEPVPGLPDADTTEGRRLALGRCRGGSGASSGPER